MLLRKRKTGCSACPMTDPATVVELWPYEGGLWHGVRRGLDEILEEGVLWGKPPPRTTIDPETFLPVTDTRRRTFLALGKSISEDYATQAMIWVPGEALDFDALELVDGAPWFTYPKPIPIELCRVECR